MISLKINNIRNFTSHLFVQDTFAEWLLVEGTIQTHSLFHVNGEVNASFFSKEEYEEHCKERFNPWKMLRPVCYEMVRGKNLPTRFKFVLGLNSQDVASILANHPDFRADNVEGMYLNIRFENGTITLTTGLSLKIFTLDKSLEKGLDSYISAFLDRYGIQYTID